MSDHDSDRDSISLHEDEGDERLAELFDDPNLFNQLLAESLDAESTVTAGSETVTLSNPGEIPDLNFPEIVELIQQNQQNQQNQQERAHPFGEIHPQLDDLGILDIEPNDEPVEVVNRGVMLRDDGFINEPENLPQALRPYVDARSRESRSGRMDQICPHCRALYFRAEKRNRVYKKCCKQGTVVLAPLEDPPQPLMDLFNKVHPNSLQFFDKMLILNSAYSCVSIGAQLDRRFANAQRGGYTFRIHGSIYHRIGSLAPIAGQAPKFAQIFFFDTAQQVNRRRQLVNREANDRQQIPDSLLESLTQCFATNNTLLRQFRQIGLQVLEHDDLAMTIQDNLPNLDRRRFNAPTTGNEIAAIVPANNPDAAPRCILVRKNDLSLHLIKPTHAALDPLSYILLFPRGELGWHYTMRKSDGRKLTLLDYVRNRVQFRAGNFNTIMKASKLFQQYLVDSYVRIESLRLLYIRMNQNRLRVELYQGLADAYRMNVEENRGGANNIGRFCVLPSSFVGGPRFMSACYQDAMAIVRKYGKPDLFITMTTNPEWPEIQEELLPGQTSWDRPELVARVFEMKKEKLIECIKRGALGVIEGIVYTVEFQKRGLPHVHMLVILDRNSKLTTPEQINRCVCAELPDPETEPSLFRKVSKFMIHRPCEHNPNAQCKVNNRCSKNFPKPYTESTIIDQAAYPKYRRSQFGPRIRVGNTEIGNEYVVPYNKYLIGYLNCHINVEICSSLQAIKYLYKYVYKGPDGASIMIEDNNRFDEVSKFVSGRYVSASESFYRIASFRLHSEFPNVYRLPVHLENHEPVVFRDGQNIEEVLERNNQSILTAWMQCNREDRPAEGEKAAVDLLYADFPEFFHYVKRTKKWARRARNIKTVGRIYTVSPQEGERFYLRLMLNHIKGAKSFADLRTVNGVVHGTYREAAAALGIIRSDAEWINLLNDAVLVQRTDLCRDMFAFLLIFCQVSDPLNLWNRFREALSEDIIFQFRGRESPEDCINQALIMIEEVLRMHGKRLSDYNLPTPNRSTRLARGNVRTLLDEELGMNTPADQAQFREMESNLTAQQRLIYNQIMREVNRTQNRRHNLSFLNAPGGTGKTYLFNTLLAAVRTSGNIALAVASSGIASLLLRNGRTAHSRFKIPLNCSDNSMCSIPLQSELANLIREAKLIVWDEAVMADKKVIQCVEKTIRNIMFNDQNIEQRLTQWNAFGNKVVVFGGDFRQILPVVPMGGKEDIINASLKQSYLWPHFRNFFLTENLRANRNDRFHRNFVDFLERIGNGEFNAFDRPDQNLIRVGESMTTQAANLEEFVHQIYPNLNRGVLNEYATTAILAPTNNHVHEINEAVLRAYRPDLEPITYLSADSVADSESEENRLNITAEFLNSQDLPGLPPHQLNLKNGAIVILMRNLNMKKGLCNGTRLIVQECRTNYKKARILTGQFMNSDVLIPRITLTSSPQDLLPFTIQRHQLPIKLAFAMTINKSQGQTLQNVGVYLQTPVFTHGQLYVALSRVTTQNSIVAYIRHNEHSGEMNEREKISFTENVVYREVLV